jgi:hypothetical protein
MEMSDEECLLLPVTIKSQEHTHIQPTVRVFGIDLFERWPALGGEEEEENHDQYARRPRA